MRWNPYFRRATALLLAWVLGVQSLIWAAPPPPRPPAPTEPAVPQQLVPYVPASTPLTMLQEALLQSAWEPPTGTATPVEREEVAAPEAPEPAALYIDESSSDPEPSLVAFAEPTTAAPSVLEPEATPSAAPPAPGLEAKIFGPQKYVRTKGKKTEFTTTVTVPPWVTSPYRLAIQNGEPNGSFRISSAWIEVNGVEVVEPNDFNQNVPGFDRTVTLTPETILEVTLASKPTSYLTINLFGESADLTPPQVSWTEPAPGGTVNDSTPRLLVAYQDAVGAGEPAASGVNTSTLQVYLDGVDQTDLFTRRLADASAELPEELALSEGAHQLRSTIEDQAGNVGEAHADFQVDLTPPAIEIVEPSSGGYLPTQTPTLRVRYQDNLGLDLSSLSITINGDDCTELFEMGPGEAVASLTFALPNGPNQIVAQIEDLGNNRADASSTFNVDVTPPSLTIGSPADGARLGNPDVEVAVYYSDDQALALGSFQALLDGGELTMTRRPDGAEVTVGSVEEGDHRLDVEIQDLAGNEVTASSSFYIDTTLPAIVIETPTSGSILATAEPEVEITYSDNQGVDLTTLSVEVQGNPRIDRFTIGPDRATGTLTAAASLPEGDTTIEVGIEDLAGNRGDASSTFTVDTIPPTGVVEEPEGNIKNDTPTFRVSYSDSGVGINPDKVVIIVDQEDQTSLFAIGDDSATAVFPTPLDDGTHDIHVAVEDRAGNPTEFDASFTVNTVQPLVTITEPSNDSFINDSTPSIHLSHRDGSGTGVDADSIQIFLQSGGDPETDITSIFQLGELESLGTLPDTSALTDGTYRLRATVSDRVGNVTEVTSTFALDTVPPTYNLVIPAHSGFTGSATPSFEIEYQDDHSGIDLSRFVFKIDGVDLTGRLTLGDTGATGTLSVEDALIEGPHPVLLTVFDRAGNQAVPAPYSFTVDTIPPTVEVELPADGSVLASSVVNVRVVYQDGTGSGVDPGSVYVEVASQDYSADFVAAASATEAEATLTLPDGMQTLVVRVFDYAANPAEAASTFLVDTQAPILSITSPPDSSSAHAESPVDVSGTVQDVDPETRVQCTVGGNTSDGVLTVGSSGPLGVIESNFVCSVALTEGDNLVQVLAFDRSGHEASAERSLKLDQTPPEITIVTPTQGEVTASTTIEVSGGVIDSSPVTVQIESPAGTVDALVDGSSFVAPAVPVGEGPEATLLVVARDEAGNSTQEPVTVAIDRTNPVISITTPVEGAYLPGPMIDVKGTVIDVSPVMVDLNEGAPATVTGDEFTARISASDGPLAIRATAKDAANNTGYDEVRVTVDSLPPVIQLTAPSDDLVTSQMSVTATGTVNDVSPVTLTLNGVPVGMNGNAFTHQVELPSEGIIPIQLAAIDAAGNPATLDIDITVDRTPPSLQVIGPAPGDLVTDLPAVVQGTVQDATATRVTVDGQIATLTQGVWQAQVDSLPEGPHAFQIVATDQAGNSATTSVDVLVDLSPPAVTITTPDNGSLTKETSVEVTGTVSDVSDVSVTVNDQLATVNGTGRFAATVSLLDGDNSIRAEATDAASRTGSAEIVVTQDAVPPEVTLTTPENISRIRGGSATAAVTDNLALAEVTLTIGNTPAQPFEPPYEIDLTVPEGLSVGETFSVAVYAADTAGNTTSVSRDVQVIADGVIVGQVMDDTSGLLLPEATVRLGERVVESDERGRYSLPTGEPEIVLVVEKDGMTSVERRVSVESGVGTVPVDARLTPLSDPQTVDVDGGLLTAELSLSESAVSIEIPPGAVSGNTAFRLSSLSAQGLPALLPLGWSPIAAFDLRTDGAVGLSGAELTVTIAGLVSGQDLHWVQFRPSLHGWRMVTPFLVAADGSAVVPLVELGSYAVVIADVDHPDLVIPEAGESLAGVEHELLPASATSTGVVEPPVIPPAGGTAVGKLSLFSPTPLPSGTVIQAEVTETFTLASGDVASEEERLQDIVLYRHPAQEGALLAATFPITPSRVFEATELVEGKVHLDILAGRESIRGSTGGSEPLTLEEGDVRLSVPGQALGEDTAISLEESAFSDFLPTSPNLTALAEVEVDFSGQRLNLNAELSVAMAVPDGGSLLVARVERFDGVPRLVVVAEAELVGDRVESHPLPGLSGIREGGRYVLYRSAVPVGFVTGVTTAAGSPVQALVETAGLPFVSESGTDGVYMAAGLVGLASVTAHVPATSLQGTGVADVVEGETTTLDIELAGTLTTAEVSPEDGSVGVELGIQLDVIPSAPFNAATVTTDNVLLYEGEVSNGQLVPLRLVLSGSGKSLAVIPSERLTPLTSYTLSASGLADRFGGLVDVPSTSFTTRDDQAPVYDTSQLVLSMPDDNGIVQITAPAGALPPGTQILIVNAGNGIVLSLTAGNDGSVTDEIPATISDRILVTLTDPEGNVTSFERSKFVAADGTTAVGAGGGVVKGPGGVELRIPEGAVDEGVVFKIEAFDESLFPPEQMPQMDEGYFGGGLKIETPDEPTFKKEVDLVFPKPADAPDDAFYYVYRRLVSTEGVVAFEVIDHAFVEGEGESAKVVTASYPFGGYNNSFGVYSMAGTPFASQIGYMFLMWSNEQVALQPSHMGVITGKVLRRVYSGETGTPQYVGVPNVAVSGTDGAGNSLLGEDFTTVAISQADGTFTLWDQYFDGGTVEIAATIDNETRTATAYEHNLDLPALVYYRKTATANITFPAEAPPPPAPQIDIQLMEVVDGSRQAVNGLVVAGTPLLIGFRSNYNVRGAEIEGEVFSVQADPLQGIDPLGMDFIINGEFTPPDPGAYTVKASAVSPFGGTAMASATFKVIAEGGGNSEVDLENAPEVITLMTVPKNNATGVPVAIFPQVSFTEPVKNLPGNVSLVEEGGASVAIALAGISPEGEVLENIESPEAAVTSLTLQPLAGLKFGTHYVLSLSSGVTDLDADVNGDPAPKNLVPFDSSFTTFGPQYLGGTEARFGASGMMVMGDRAYVAENTFYSAVLRVYDITDPVEPQEIASARNSVAGRPVDLSGEEGRVVIGTAPTYRSTPSNLFVFDVTSDAESPMIGAVSVASSAGEGFLQRFTVHQGMAYTITGRRGVQVVDIGQAVLNYSEATRGGTDSVAYWDMRRDLYTAGRGFGQSAIGWTIPIKKPDGQDYYLNDIAAGTLGGQTRAVVAGEGPLIVVNTEVGTSDLPVEIRTQVGDELTFGQAVTLTQREGRDLALVAGSGVVKDEQGNDQQGPVLAIVDLSTPQSPFTMSIIPLDIDGGAYDILITEDTAIVSGESRVALVNLTDLNAPKVAGVIEGVGGRLAISEDKILLSSAMSVFGGETELGGVRTAAIDAINIITGVDKNPIALARNLESAEPQTVSYRTLLPLDEIVASKLEILNEGQVLSTLDAPLNNDGRGQVTLPVGTYHPDEGLKVRLVVESDTRESNAPEKRLSGAPFEVVPLNRPALQIGRDRMDIAAVNQAWLQRLQDEPNEPLPPARWLAPGRFMSGGFGQETGIFAGEITPVGIKGDRGSAVLVLNGTVLAETAPFTFEHGEPNTLSAAVLQATAPEQSPDTPGRVPADGTTEIRLILEGARDQSRDWPLTNIAKDGTPVTWTIIEGEDGELLDAEESVMMNGRAEVGFRAGIFPGSVLIRAESGEGDYRLERTVHIMQEELRITMNADNWPTIIAEITSDAGPPQDRTPIQWGTNQGTVQYEREVHDGVSIAEWRPQREIFGFGRQVLLRENLVFATVGRERGDLLFDRQGRPVEGDLAIRFQQDRMLSDVPDVARSPGPDPVLDIFPTRLTGTVTGEPGDTVTLALGSPMFPGIEPVAAYPFDTVENDEADDIYGGPPARLQSGVSVNETDFPGTLRFTGSGGLAVFSPAAQVLRTNFGFNAALRFDSLSVGQTVLEKAGSFGIGVVEEAGESRIEFFVVSNGERRNVVSSQTLSTNTVYSLSAQFRDGQLRLSVGGDDSVNRGDIVAAADASSSPLIIGPTFQGNIDDVAFYDFTGAPLLLFANGSMEQEVTLGPDGSAEIEVVSGATFAQSFGSSSLASESPPATGPLAERLRTVPIGIYEAPNELEVVSYSMLSALAAGIRPVLEPCLDGLATGEEGGKVGAVCDIAASFVPGVGAVQDSRDLYFVGKAVVDGKEGVGDYIKGGFALVGLALTAFPAARGVATTLDRARVAVRGSRAETRLAKEAMERVGRVVAGEVNESTALLKILAGESGTPAGKRALTRLLGICSVQVASLAPLAPSTDCLGISYQTQRTLERLATRYASDADELLQGLGKIVDNTRFGRSDRTRLDVIERLIKGLDETPIQIAGDALDGAAVFIVHTKSPIRMQKIWQELTQEAYENLPVAKAQNVVQDLYRMIKKGDDHIEAVKQRLPQELHLAFEKGWHNFIAQGAGVSRSFRSTRGFFHALELTLKEAPETIRAINRSMEGFYGFPDLIVEKVGRLVQKEYKAIGPGKRLSEHGVAQLKGNIAAAILRAIQANPQGRLTREYMEEELKNGIIYIFRGNPDNHLNLFNQLLEVTRKALPEKHKDLAEVLVEKAKASFEGTFPY